MSEEATKAVSLPIVAWTALTQAGQIGYFDGRPMVMPGPVGNDCHPDALTPHAPAQAEIDRLRADNGQWIEETARLREALEKIDNWSRAYPLDVFPEPTSEQWAQLHEAAKAFSPGIDRFGASNMRHLVAGVGEIARAALTAGKAPL